jgi:hypothetical protein
MIFTAILDFYVLYYIPHCFICRPSDSTVSEDAALRTVATFAFLVRHSIPLGKMLIYNVFQAKMQKMYLIIALLHVGQVMY